MFTVDVKQQQRHRVPLDISNYFVSITNDALNNRAQVCTILPRNVFPSFWANKIHILPWISELLSRWYCRDVSLVIPHHSVCGGTCGGIFPREMFSRRVSVRLPSFRYVCPSVSKTLRPCTYKS